MTKYETWSLILTGIYDLLTFLLLIAVAYEAFIKPKLPNVAFYIQTKQKDTESTNWQRQVVDFVFENKGKEIRNIRITSEPDDLNWGELGPEDIAESFEPKKTSEYFRNIIPSMAQNEKLALFWCDYQANMEVALKPFRIFIEFDNPAFAFPRRVKRTFEFDLSVFEETMMGVTTRYDIHNVAEELARIRKILAR